MSRRARLAVPLVVTFASGCTSTEAPTPKPDPVEPKQPPSVATTSPSASAPIEYDGYGSCFQMVDGEKKFVPKCPESLLPPAAPDALVYRYGGDECRSTPDGKRVRCPASGPNAILPEPSSVPDGDGNISLQYGSLTCFRHVTVHCPPNIACNPPPPTSVPCPAALLPKLAPGVKPTKTDKGKCFYGLVEVSC